MRAGRTPTILTCLWAASLLACGSRSATDGDEHGETTDGSGSGTGEGESSGESGEPEDCGFVSIAPTYVHPRLMFVVDKSQSMLAPWDHDGDPNTPDQTRWASAQQLVATFADHWNGYGVLGLGLFPSADACPDASSMTPSCDDASACMIASPPEVGLAEANAATLIAALPEPDADPIEFAGASPAAAAYASAVEHLRANLADSEPSAPGYIVLVTDGRSNCSASLDAPGSFAVYDDHLRDLVEAALLDDGIRTAVIAVDEAADPSLDLGVDTIPNFDPRPALQQLGQAGGVRHGAHPYFSASDPNAIFSVFARPDLVGGCYVELESTAAGLPTPEQIPLVRWEMNGEPIEYVESDACESEDGWTWLVSNDLSIGEIVLFCGQVCDAFEMSGNTFDGYYGCPETI